jgi:hypothetical protein
MPLKIGLVKIGFGLAAGVLIVGALAVVAMAWVRGGVQPARTVEIPVSLPSGAAGGA